MGCLNSDQNFEHRFGNIHLSGPCNRKCYWCIGQHMMALDSYNNLDLFPLVGLYDFTIKCKTSKVKEINLTGTNTDPMLYRWHYRLVEYLKTYAPGVIVGIRTNGTEIVKKPGFFALYDKASISFSSFDKEISRKVMGGDPIDLESILEVFGDKDLKINIVLCPEILNNTVHERADLCKTLENLGKMGIKQVNLREPYGQPHVGDPFGFLGNDTDKTTYGMPTYNIFGMEVTYWNVHYVQVESINLYANGNISHDYPITRGHDPETGKVLDQSQFVKFGRIQEQWLGVR